jgi:hypothetical protein
MNDILPGIVQKVKIGGLVLIGGSNELVAPIENGRGSR